MGAWLSLRTQSFIGPEWFVVAFCLTVVSFFRNSLSGLLLIIIAGLICGLWRGGGLITSQKPLLNKVGQIVSLNGRVSEDPTFGLDGDLRFRLSGVSLGAEDMGGDVWVSASERIDLKRSDKVTIEGRLSEGFGAITASMYRARILNVERADYADVARDIRDSFAGGIRKAVQEPQASLGAGFLLGQKTALPEKLDLELRLLGLTHIVVASGYNLTILIRFARRLFVRISRFSALALSAGLVYGFTQITGWSPSMNRAGLIAALSLLAWYYGRKFHPFVLLSFAAGITVLLNPTYAWGDVGWLLSFSSFIGVIILAPLLHAYFWGDQKPNALRQIIIETMSAQILTLPIIAYVFGQYSPLALPANLLILPLIPLAMLLTLLAGIGGLLFPSVGSIIGWPAESLMRYMTFVIDRMSEFPAASSEIIVTTSMAIVMYLGLFASIIFLKRRTKLALRDYNVIE